MRKKYKAPSLYRINLQSNGVIALSLDYGGNGGGRPAQTRERIYSNLNEEDEDIEDGWE